MDPLGYKECIGVSNKEKVMLTISVINKHTNKYFKIIE